MPKIEIIFRRHRIITNIVGNCNGVTPTTKLHEEKNFANKEVYITKLLKLAWCSELIKQQSVS